MLRALALEGISRSEVSRICARLDPEVEAFRHRLLHELAYPYLWLDATHVKVREGRRVVAMAGLVATGPRAAPTASAVGLHGVAVEL